MFYSLSHIFASTICALFCTTFIGFCARTPLGSCHIFFKFEVILVLVLFFITAFPFMVKEFFKLFFSCCESLMHHFPCYFVCHIHSPFLYFYKIYYTSIFLISQINLIFSYLNLLFAFLYLFQ